MVVSTHYPQMVVSIHYLAMAVSIRYRQTINLDSSNNNLDLMVDLDSIHQDNMVVVLNQFSKVLATMMEAQDQVHQDLVQLVLEMLTHLAAAVAVVHSIHRTLITIKKH